MTDKYAGHTPGPWQVGVRSTTGEQFGVHARFLAKHIGVVSGQANARLIADAPLLLKALEGVRWVTLTNNSAAGKLLAIESIIARVDALNSDAPLSIGEGDRG